MRELQFGKYRIYPRSGHWIVCGRGDVVITTFDTRHEAIHFAKTMLWAYKEGVRCAQPQPKHRYTE